jgi:hypothetical protein
MENKQSILSILLDISDDIKEVMDLDKDLGEKMLGIRNRNKLEKAEEGLRKMVEGLAKKYKIDIKELDGGEEEPEIWVEDETEEGEEAEEEEEVLDPFAAMMEE